MYIYIYILLLLLVLLSDVVNAMALQGNYRSSVAYPLDNIDETISPYI